MPYATGLLDLQRNTATGAEWVNAKTVPRKARISSGCRWARSWRKMTWLQSCHTSIVQFMPVKRQWLR